MTAKMAFQLALGCSGGVHRRCCGGCATCEELFAEYGYTTLELSGAAGPVSLLTGSPPGTSTTWPGFTNGTLAIPSANSGPCSDQIIQEVGGIGSYYFDPADAVRFWAGTFDFARIASAITYSCVSNVAGRGIGLTVEYQVTGNVAAEYSEGSFTDWTWDTHVLDGRRATKTLADGSVAIWLRQPVGGTSRTLLRASVTHTESNLDAGNPVVTSVTMPTVPYDYLGIMVGTTSIS